MKLNMPLIVFYVLKGFIGNDQPMMHLSKVGRVLPTEALNNDNFDKPSHRISSVH